MKIVNNNQVILDKPIRKTPKKVTGTRFGKLVDVNPWGSEFEAWCQITGVYEEKFEGNKYTEAGNILEPKLIEKMQETLPFGRIVTADQVFGSKAKHMYDYYPEEEIFGGMWDGLWIGDSGNQMGIVEIKTTKRYEDWLKGVPANYQVQAELYAMLSGLDYITFGVVFLEEDDYDNLEDLELVENVNYRIITYRLDDTKKELIKGRMDYIREWYSKHVTDQLVSPIISDKKIDQEIMDILTTKMVEDDVSLEEMIKELEAVKEFVADERWEKLKIAQKREKELEDLVRGKLIEVIESDDQMNKASVEGETISVTVSKSDKVTKKFDEDRFALENAEVYTEFLTIFNEKAFTEEFGEKYAEFYEDKVSTTYRRSTKKK